MEIILNNEAGELARGKVTVDENGDTGTGSVKVEFSGKMPMVVRVLVMGLKALDDKKF